MLTAQSPAQQETEALLALSHALDSKLAFTTTGAGIWEVISDDSYISGTAVKVTSRLESVVDGPATIRFWAKGGLPLRRDRGIFCGFCRAFQHSEIGFQPFNMAGILLLSARRAASALLGTLCLRPGRCDFEPSNSECALG